MDIMQSNKASVLLLTSLMLAMFPAQAELKVTPSLSSNIYAYGIKNQTPDTDKGMAYEVNPGLNLALSGKWLSTSLNLQSQNLAFDDAQRDNQSYFQYDWQSRANLLDDALTFNVGARQDYRNASELTARYQDEISSTSERARADSQSAGMTFNHDRFDWARFNLALNASRSATSRYDSIYDTPANPDTGLENSQLTATFGLNSKDRNRKFFWGFDGQASKIDRDVRQPQYNRRLEGTVGVPFFWRVSMIATGAVESNSNLEGASSVFSQYRNRHALGGGLEWKISDKSWWNVTYNKDNDAEKDAEYIGTAFELVPSQRTSLSGSVDRRFFGRTAQIKGAYKLKHLRMALTVNDTVGSVLGLGGGNSEGSLFICPPGVAPGLDSCFQPPTASYIPALGEQYYNISDPLSDLSEFVVVRREVSYQIGYDFNRLSLAADIGQRKDQLIEQRSVTDNQFVNISANWQLNARNHLSVSAGYSDLSYLLAGQAGNGELSGISKSVTLALKREVNQALSANMNLRRVDVDYAADSRNYQENRLWLGLTYKF